MASDGVLERGGPLGKLHSAASVAVPLDRELALASVHSSGGVADGSATAIEPLPTSPLDLRRMAGDSPVLGAGVSCPPHGSGRPGGGAGRLTETDLDEADCQSMGSGSPLPGKFITTCLGVRAS